MTGEVEDDENWWIEEGISKEEVDFLNGLASAKVRQATPQEMHELMREAEKQSPAQGVADFDPELFRLAFYVTPSKVTPRNSGLGTASERFNWEGFWERYHKIEAGIEPDTEIRGGDDIRRVVELGAKRLDLARRGGASEAEDQHLRQDSLGARTAAFRVSDG